MLTNASSKASGLAPEEEACQRDYSTTAGYTCNQAADSTCKYTVPFDTCLSCIQCSSALFCCTPVRSFRKSLTAVQYVDKWVCSSMLPEVKKTHQ